MPPVRSVIITGASTGIGRACALHMDRLGWRVFAGVRNDADAASLRQASSPQLSPIHLDVALAEDIAAARRFVDEAAGQDGLAGLVNNAGIAYGGPIEYLDLDEVRRLFEVNFFGTIAMIQAFLDPLRIGHGRVVNMSSISGSIASPFLSPYTTSKWAIEALSDALRVELDPWKIPVAVVEPGAINTPIWNKGLEAADRILARYPPIATERYSSPMHIVLGGLKPHGVSVENVAEAVAHALTSPRPHTRYPVGRAARLVRLFRLFPDRLRDWVFLTRFKGGR